MKLNKKKGFTIVELVIVIAIIAILAAVLIPTFSNIIKTANISADIQMCKNLNTALAADEALSGKHETASDAIAAAKESGYSVDKLTPTTNKFDVVWDSTTNRFLLLDESGAIVYQDEGKATGSMGNVPANKWKLWKITDDYGKNNGFSVYLTGNRTLDSLDISTGLDVGENTSTTVNFATDSAVKVTVFTNGGDFNVNAPNATVSHFGMSDETYIESIANGDCYHEFGISQSISLKSGKVVIEEKAFIPEIVITDDADDVLLEISAAAHVLNLIDTNNKIDDDVKQNIGEKFFSSTTTVLALTANGMTEFERVEDALRVSGKKTIKLLKDYDLNITENAATQIFDLSDTIFDFNNKTVNVENFKVIYVGNNFTIKNGTFNAIKNGNYSVFIGDEVPATHVILEDLVLYGGANIYNSTDIKLRNVEAHGRQYYAVWADEGVVDLVVESGNYFKGMGGYALGRANESSLICIGGAFDSDPTKSLLSQGTEPTYNAVADGYVAIETDGFWTVSKSE